MALPFFIRNISCLIISSVIKVYLNNTTKNPVKKVVFGNSDTISKKGFEIVCCSPWSLSPCKETYTFSNTLFHAKKPNHYVSRKAEN